MPIEQLIFTDRPPGKGVDPQRRGYQLAACSPGVDEASRLALQRMCPPLGNAVHESGSRELRDREERWMITPGRPKQMPEEILEGFPVIWSYARLRDDWFALMRVRYLGISHDNRHGNFIAHALLFNTEALAPCGYQPLALTRSNLFRSDDDGQTTELPALAAFPALPAATLTPTGFGAQLLRKGPIEQELPRLLSALGPACEGSDRPLLLKIADWRQAAAIVESLLSLLPPGGRSRLTFCTHHAGSISLSGTGEEAAKRTYDLVFLCGQAGASAAMPTQNFTVFDLDSNAPSAQGGAAPSAYAAFAAAAVRANAADRLGFHHDLARAIGVDRDPRAWDALVPLAQLGGLTAAATDLAEPFKAAAAVASTPARAAGALSWLSERFRILCDRERLDQVRAIAPAIASLVDCASGDPGAGDASRRAGADAVRTPSTDAARAFVAEAAGHAATALRRGRARLAEQILVSCGREGDPQLTQILGAQFSAGGAAVASGPEERPAMAGLLLRGLQSCQARQISNPGAAAVPMPLIAPLLLAAYRAAGDVGPEVLDKAWQQTGENTLRYFTEPRGERLQTLRTLLGAVPPQAMQAGCARLTLAMLASPEVVPDEVPGLLQTVARLMPSCPPQDNLPQKAASEARRLIRDPLKLCIALAGMCDAAGTGKPEAQELYKSFTQAAQGIDRPTLRQQLAIANCSMALAAEMVADIAGNIAAARERWEKMFAAQPQALSGVCQATAVYVRAGRTQKPDNYSHVLTMTDWLLAIALTGGTPADQAAGGPGQLVMAALAAAPLEPLAGLWKPLFDRLPAGIDLTGEPKLAVLRCMSTTQAAAQAPGWSLAAFPHADPLWKVAASLSDLDRTQALGWCHQLFTATGMTTPADANALVGMLHPLGRCKPAEIADFILNIVRERDPVTQITAAMALAQATADDPRRANGQPEVFAILVGTFDKATRRLMESHLKHRCARGGPAYEETMEKLCQQTHLTPPPRPSAQPQQSQGVLNGAMKWLRRGLGGQ